MISTELKVRKASYDLYEIIREGLDEMVDLNMPLYKRSVTHKVITCLAILFADTMSDLMNLILRYRDFAGDDVRAASIHQVYARLSCAGFIVSIGPPRDEDDLHGQFIGTCETALDKAQELVDLWNKLNPKTRVLESPLDRAQKLLSEMPVAPTENE